MRSTTPTSPTSTVSIVRRSAREKTPERDGHDDDFDGAFLLPGFGRRHEPATELHQGAARISVLEPLVPVFSKLTKERGCHCWAVE